MMQEFVQQVTEVIKENMNGIHTAMPGKILSFDAGKGVATVQPVMKYKKPDGTTMDFPQISGVPVWIPQGAGQDATVAYPIKAGDGCLIIVGEQSIDYWMYGQETSTDLAFDMSNAMCIPGLFAKANSVTAEACSQNAIIADVKGTRITVKKGSVKIEAKEAITIEAKEAITIDAKEITINGKTTVNGDFTVQNGVATLN